MMPIVWIDLNVRVRGNLAFAGFEDIDNGPVSIGQEVDVCGIETNLGVVGSVVDIDFERKLVYLEVDWNSLCY